MRGCGKAGECDTVGETIAEMMEQGMGVGVQTGEWILKISGNRTDRT